MRIASVIGPITALTPAGAAPQAMWPGYFDSKSVLFSWWPPNTQTAWADAAFTGSITGNVLTVTAVATPSVWPGLVLNPSGLTVTDWNFTNSAHSGAGGTGTYGLSGTGSEPAGTAFTGSSNAPQYYKVYKNGTLICGGSTNTTGLTNPGVTPSAVPGNILSGFALNHPFPWYVDNNVTPGVAATYTVTAFQNGQESPAGPALTMTPLANGSSQAPTPIVEPSTWIQSLQIPAVAPIICNTQADLENAFNLVAVGGVTATLTGPNLIVLTAGNTFNIPTANGWTPPIFTGTGWTYIISSQTPEYTSGGKLPAYNGSVSQPAPLAVNCTATIAAGATSATMTASQSGITDSSGNWLLKSGWYYVHFYEPTFASTGWGGLTEERLCVFTQGQSTFTWNLNNGHYASPGLSAPATAWGQTSGNAQVAVCYLTGVTPYDSKTSGAMATLNMNSLVNSSCLTIQPGTTKVRFIGIEFTNTGTGALSSTTEGTAYVHFSNSQPPPAGTLPGPATISTPAESIYFDRCLIGAPTDASNYQYVPHGISFVNCNHLLVNQCYTYGVAYNFYGAGAAGGGPGSGDANCYALNGNNHAWLNSYFQCVAESLLYGGGYVDPVNLPTNIAFRGNMSHKPLSWLAGANTGIASYTLNGVNQSSSEGANGCVLSAPWPFVTQTVAADFDPIAGGNGVVTVTVTNGSTTVSFGSTLSATQNFQPWMHVRGGTGYGMFGRETKNLFELKVGFTVDVSNNLFLNNWTANAAGYHGAPVALGARDQQAILYSQATMASPWNAVTDVNVYNNLMYNIETPFVSFTSDSCPSVYDQRCRLYNNLIFVNSPKSGAERFTGIRLQNPVPDHILDHNTMILNTSLAGASAQGAPICVSLVSVGTTTPGYFGDPVPYGPNPTTLEDDRLTITNNIFWAGGNTWTFNSLSPTPALGSAWPNLTWSNNLTIGDTSSYAGVPAANTNVAVGSIGFQNYQGNRAFPLHPSDWNVVGTQYATASTTGTPLGATFAGSTSTSVGPVGALLSAAGASAFTDEALPVFWNRVREGQLTSGSLSLTTGWPNSDFTMLLSNATAQSWNTGTWHCGFIGTGSESISGSGVGSIVHGSGGAYTTFTLTGVSGTIAFSVTGTTGGVTNLFAYLPGYTGNTSVVDNVANSSAYFTNNVNVFKNLRHIRTMIPSNSWFNTSFGSSAIRHTPANTVMQPGSGVVHSTISWNGSALGSAWPQLSGTYAVTTGGQGNSPSNTWYWGTFTQGSTAVTWITAAPASATLTYGLEAYPVEYIAGLATAAGCGLWVNTPLMEDGANGAAGSWTSSVMQWLAANFSGPIYYEMGNENWNGGYFGNGLLTAAASFYGYSSIYSYLAYRYHAFANLGRTYHGSSWGQNVFQVPCWQVVSTDNYSNVFLAMQSAGYGVGGGTSHNLSSDIHYFAIAPYLTPSGLTSSSTLANVASAITSQAAGAAGSNAENTFVLAKHYGMQMCSYEGGIQWNSVSGGYTGAQLSAVLDDTTGAYQSAIKALYQAYFNVPYVFMSHTESGVTGQTTGEGLVDEYSFNYANFLAGNATYNAITSFNNGNLTVAAKNMVTGSGSSIPGGNYADHTGATATLNLTGLAPFYFSPSNYVPYVFYCPTAQVRTIVGNFTGSGTTNVWIDGVETSTGLSTTSATTLASSFSLSAGWHYILIGNGTSQAGVTVNSLTFN